MFISKSTTNPEKPLLLVFPFGLLSHYLRCLVLGRELKKYFTVKFLDNPAYSNFIEQEDFDTFTCSYLDPAKAIEGVKRFDLSWLQKEELEQLFLRQVAVIQKLKPALVLGDFSPTLRMAADATGVTFVSLFNGYMSKYYAGTRNISKNHPAEKLIRFLPAGLGAILTRVGESRAFKILHSPFREIRRSYDLPTCASYLDELEGDLNLVCDLPLIFPQKALPSNYHLVGPLYYDSDIPAFGIPVMSEPKKKTILVSMGSSGNWQQVTFLNDQYYNIYNVIAIGDNTRALKGNHIGHLPFAGMHEIFPHIDLLICHGGNGTLYQALYYNVPVLVRTNHCEQEWNLSAFSALKIAGSLDSVVNEARLQQIVTGAIESGKNGSLARISMDLRHWQKKMPAIIHKIAGSIIKSQVRTNVINR
jgi:UDP:flavonoid glycosyltransferase YjiC (YdhE family)